MREWMNILYIYIFMYVCIYVYMYISSSASVQYLYICILKWTIMKRGAIKMKITAHIFSEQYAILPMRYKETCKQESYHVKYRIKHVRNPIRARCIPNSKMVQVHGSKQIVFRSNKKQSLTIIIIHWLLRRYFYQMIRYGIIIN